MKEKQKYINYIEFRKICKNMDESEDLNILYKKTLFQAIYHGIYCDDFSVFKNLHTEDISADNIVTLRNDNGETWTMPIPQELTDNLRSLSGLTGMMTKNRSAAYEISFNMEEQSRCFKQTTRNEKDTIYTVLTVLLRKITKAYAGRTISSTDLFISGVLYRIQQSLAESGITMQEAFLTKKNARSIAIIDAELQKSRYNGTTTWFKCTRKEDLQPFL